MSAHRQNFVARLARRWWRWTVAALLGVALLAICGWFALALVPLPQRLFEPAPPGIELADREGRPLRLLRGDDGQFARPVEFHEMPPALIHATIAAEDQRFWQHHGVDPRAIVRAAWSLVRHRRVVSGASTITQQLIKNAERRPRTWRTKCIEAVQAMRLEQIWDKQRILTAYLNRVDYGNLNTGCGPAARFYFGKPLAELSPAECALLAGLPQAPTRLNPRTHLDRAQRRQQWILRRMRACDFLTETEFARAGVEPLKLAGTGRSFEAPHFVDWLTEEWNGAAIAGWSGASPPAARLQSPNAPTFTDVPGHPPAVRTTLDLELNRFIARVLRQQLAELEARQVHDGAVVVIDNRTGGVMAMVGSGDYFAPRGGQVNGAWSRRSPGSALKPFTYLLGFERGITPASLLADVPSSFATATGEFIPVNFDRAFRGPVRARSALACSLNVPAVRLLEDLGGAAVLQSRLQACGLTTVDRESSHYGLGLTLGNAEVRLLELANAYACLARLGEYRPLRVFDHLPPGEPRQVFDRRAAWLLADVLSDNDARAPAFGIESSLRYDFRVACKTGTSSDFRDNWALGYTPEFTVGVWGGNFDGSPMQRVSGVTGAGPLLHAVITRLHEQRGTTWYERPPGIVEMTVSTRTGHRMAQATPETVVEKFMSEWLPPDSSAHDFDAQGRMKLGGEYREWWLAGGAARAARFAMREDADSVALRIISPQSGATYFLDPDLPAGGRRLRLRAQGSGVLRWECESLSVGAQGAESQAELSEGRHQLVVRDVQTGRTAATWIRVKRL